MTKYQPFQLKPFHFVSCGPTLVGSITGQNEEASCARMQEAAAEDGENPDGLVDSAFRHQCRAIELSGFDLFTPDGEGMISARDIPGELTIPPDAMTVQELFNQNQSGEVLACIAGGIRSGMSQPEAHSFAIQGPAYFDNNCGDELGTTVPSWLRNFRLARYVVVRKRAERSSDD